MGSWNAGYRGQQDHEPHPGQVTGDHDAAPVEPVGEHAAQRAEHHDRHDPDGRGDADPQGRVGSLVDQDD
jgi:hypothetical protein